MIGFSQSVILKLRHHLSRTMRSLNVVQGQVLLVRIQDSLNKNISVFFLDINREQHFDFKRLLLQYLVNFLIHYLYFLSGLLSAVLVSSSVDLVAFFFFILDKSFSESFEHFFNFLFGFLTYAGELGSLLLLCVALEQSVELGISKKK